MGLKSTVSIALMALAATAYGADHSQHKKSEKSENTQVQFNKGKKWETDAPLRQGMEALKKASEGGMNEIHNGKDESAIYKKIGNLIKEQTDFIFKNCKLAPEADKELHKILLPIVKEGKVLLSKTNNHDKHEALTSVMLALMNYGIYFDHKDWEKVK